MEPTLSKHERRNSIAAASGVALPENTGRVRVRMSEIGGGGRWLMCLYGDLRATVLAALWMAVLGPLPPRHLQ